MKILVVGTGYVGLVTGVCLASIGHEVTCYDNNESKIVNLNNGIIPIYEPGLSDLIVNNRSKISFTSEMNADTQYDFVFLAVGTPSNSDGSVNMEYFWSAVSDIIARFGDKELNIVVKSTVTLGTNKKLHEFLKEKNVINYTVSSNPEFLREGAAVYDFFNPDRIIVGLFEDKLKAKFNQLYRHFSAESVLIFYTDPTSSELIKYASNVFLANKVALINEMADLCEKTGADIYQVSKGIGLDRRIGSLFLNPGPGFGGSCFPKDCLGLLSIAHEYKADMPIIKAVVASNDTRSIKLTERIANIIGKDKEIAIFGLAFKAETDDIRESPAIKVVNNLLSKGYKLKAYDPKASENARIYYQNIDYSPKIVDIKELFACEAAVILTEWEEFKEIDWQATKLKYIFDFRNIIQKEISGVTVIKLGIVH